VDPIPRTIQQIVRQGVSLCDDWQDLVKYLSFYFKNKRNAGDKNKKGKMLTGPGFLYYLFHHFAGHATISFIPKSILVAQEKS